MPDFVKEYQLETRHSLTTSYQYLTEIRRFFSWLIAENLTQAKSPSQVLPSDLEKLSRSDVMLYLDKLEHSRNKQGHLNSPTTVNRSLNALRSLYKYLRSRLTRTMASLILTAMSCSRSIPFLIQAP